MFEKAKLTPPNGTNTATHRQLHLQSLPQQRPHQELHRRLHGRARKQGRSLRQKAQKHHSWHCKDIQPGKPCIQHRNQANSQQFNLKTTLI